MTQEAIETLERICERVDTVNLKDPEAWDQMRRALCGVRRRLAGTEPATCEICRLAESVFQQVAAGCCKDSLAAVDAAADALQAAASFLGGRSETDLQPAIGRLRKAAGPQAPAAPDLDEVAALLVQVEPEDAEGLARLAERLSEIAREPEYGSDMGGPMKEASDLLGALVSGGGEAPDAVFSRVGELIETAVRMRDQGGEGIEPATGSPAGDKSASESEQDGRLPEDADPELIGEFVAEAADLIEKAEEALLTLETDPDDIEAVGTVFRAFHTIKGNAAFLELDLLSEMGHRAESLLSRVRDGEIRYVGGYADLALRALDMLNSLVEGFQAALESGRLLKPEGYDELAALLESPESHGISEQSEDDGAPRVGDLLVAQGTVERSRLEDAVRRHPDKPVGIGVIRSRAASAAEVGKALRTQNRIRGGRQVVDSSVRVTTSRLDRLIDMVGELVIAHSMVVQDDVVINGTNYDLLKKVSHTAKIVRELQDLSMSMRMVPLKATFNKMSRLVRDLARKVGKEVRLLTEGEDTEIDRNLVDIIADPLVHMVRNAVDHGIEAPDGREAAGKERTGTVALCAYHSAGNVVVEIRDDGRGLDREGILAKAREQGLVAAGSSVPDRDVCNLIFEPGFSTAREVTDVSGRGVGMDVVKRNIESLRGQVDIQSTPGKGSVFKMSLPLTLAIIDGMVVRVGREQYVIPTVSIVRSIKPDSGEISSVLERGEMLSNQGKLIPIFRLAGLYQVPGGSERNATDLVVVIEDEGDQAGLLVEELVGRQQVVIKSLGGTMQHIPGISGGAIMPNGRVGLILDVGGLVKLAHADGVADGSGGRARQ